MTDAPPRDFLSECVPSTTGNPMLEQIRDRGADALLSVFRLVKNAMIHAIDNDAVRETATQAAEVLQGFSGEVGMPVTFTFVEDTVFVCAQLLRASRKVYQSAMELGEIVSPGRHFRARLRAQRHAGKPARARRSAHRCATRR